jgi:hypothetical protein
MTAKEKRQWEIENGMEWLEDDEELEEMTNEELLFELRANHERGTKIVNILTGRTIQL